MNFIFHRLGISSSQLANSIIFFRGVGGSTTNQIAKSLPIEGFIWINRRESLVVS
jgi:hypothetical protein